MLNRILLFLIAASAGVTPAAARHTYGPPATAKRIGLNTVPRAPLSATIVYRQQDDLLTANGIQIAKGSARRPIAPNAEIAVERASGLVDEFGDAKKPVRLLLRVGTSF